MNPSSNMPVSRQTSKSWYDKVGLADAFGEAAKKKLFTAGLTKGDIFINQFEGIDHEKFFIVAGLSGDKIFSCSIYINSDIHPSIERKPALKVLQVPLMMKNYGFLKHNSYACCSTPLPMETEKIHHWMQQGTCKVISSLNETDLGYVTSAIVNSGLLSEEEIELYFS